MVFLSSVCETQSCSSSFHRLDFLLQMRGNKGSGASSSSSKARFLDNSKNLTCIALCEGEEGFFFTSCGFLQTYMQQSVDVCTMNVLMDQPYGRVRKQQNLSFSAGFQT